MAEQLCSQTDVDTTGVVFSHQAQRSDTGRCYADSAEDAIIKDTFADGVGIARRRTNRSQTVQIQTAA